MSGAEGALAAIRSCGHLSARLADALSDGTISPDESQAILAEIGRARVHLDDLARACARGAAVDGVRR